MRILVVGSGGREHALAWKLAQSSQVTEIISAPGNPGMAELGRAVPVPADDLQGLSRLAEDESVDLVVVGPEAPLVGGLSDILTARNIPVFGPSRAAAEMEGSKVFCRELARRHGVPMAEGESFDDPDAAFDYARTISPPIVVKAEGLAAGKGVIICADLAEARAAIDGIMRERMFGEAGSRVVVEEFLEGRETSIFCLTDGEARVILEPAQDYKRARDGDAGLNTGGMGCYSPVPWLSAGVREQAIREIVMPLLDGLAEEGRPYRGCLYGGLMITDKGPRLIEINARFGDPETQVLLPRLRSDLAELLAACAMGELAAQSVEWSGEAAVSVVVASRGYPEAYETGVGIEGIGQAESVGNVAVFHAGTTRKEGRLVSAGGRVLSVSAWDPSIPEARARAYEAVGRIQMDGAYARSDIASGV
ncbi:MAG: phosphoribosylamine--glycine ligase [Actinomycetota bacterium]